MYAIYNPENKMFLNFTKDLDWIDDPDFAWQKRIKYLAERKMNVLKSKNLISQSCRVTNLLSIKTNIGIDAGLCE